MRNRLTQEWQNIPQATIRCCIGNRRGRCQACVNSRGVHTVYWTATLTFLWKLWNSIWTLAYFNGVVGNGFKNLTKKKINNWKNMFTSLFLYNVNIVAFILFVEIHKNISVAKHFLDSIYFEHMKKFTCWNKNALYSTNITF